mgnify:CR=1 FL=1
MYLIFVSIICTVLKILAIVVPLLISVAYFTIAERKIMGVIQRRKLSNVIGFLNLLQLLDDGLKPFVKETSNSNIIIFLIAPMVTFLLSLIGWAVSPLSAQIVLADWNFVFVCHILIKCLWDANGRMV